MKHQEWKKDTIEIVSRFWWRPLTRFFICNVIYFSCCTVLFKISMFIGSCKLFFMTSTISSALENNLILFKSSIKLILQLIVVNKRRYLIYQLFISWLNISQLFVSLYSSIYIIRHQPTNYLFVFNFMLIFFLIQFKD